MYPRIYTRTSDKPSTAYFSPLFIRDAHARNWLGHTCAIQDLYSPYSSSARTGYDLAYVNEALLLTGKVNTQFPTEYWGYNELNFASTGKIHAEGFQLGYEKAVSDYLSFGLLTSALHVSSSLAFVIAPRLREVLHLPVPNTTLQGREREIYNAFLNAFDLLNLQAPEWSATGLGDTDLYARFGKRIDYRYKFRRIDLGVRVGAIAPTTVPYSYANPAAISLGGGGFAGVFVQPEFELELKHDWLVGLWARVEARANKNFYARVPVKHAYADHTEPINFGAVMGEFNIKPGVTAGFCPYARITDLVDGFGAQLLYVYVHHFQDTWTDLCPNRSYEANTCLVNQLSSWTDSHVGVTLFLDLNKTKLGYCNAPEYFLDVLIPIDFLSTKNVGKSLRVSLGFEFSF